MASESYLPYNENDFRFLKELKDILIEELFRIQNGSNDPTFSDPELKQGYYTETDDGREVRVILPAGFRQIWDHFQKSEAFGKMDFNLKSGSDKEEQVNDHREVEISFVGFIGNKKMEVNDDEDLLTEVNRLDSLIVGELSEIDGMLAYVTGERVKGGDYGNLVLFRDRGVVQNLFKSDNHGTAVSVISPRFYSDVRIHSGKLQEGLTSPMFVLQKTLFLCFTLPPQHPGCRRVQIWRAGREESDVVKVLPPPVWRRC